MCGIVGVYNKNGLTEQDVKKFTAMLERARSRGIDATGVISQDMLSLKAPVASFKFVETEKYKAFAKRIIGQKFVIGHCRQASRGSPEDNQNNHPITMHIDEEEKIAIVHNGAVECRKWDDDPNKNDKKKEKTDTYIFLNAIKSFYVNEGTGEDRLAVSVRKAFEDVHTNAVRNSSVIVVCDKDNIIFCKSYGKPMSFQFLEDGGKIYFASEPVIIRPEISTIADTDIKVRKWSDLEDCAILSIKVEDGRKNDDFLSIFVPPVPIRDRFEIVKEEKFADKATKKTTATLNDWNSSLPAVTCGRGRISDPIRHSDVDFDFNNEETRGFYATTCFECFSSRIENEDEMRALRAGFEVYCTYYESEVDANLAFTCDYFQSRLARNPRA